MDSAAKAELISVSGDSARPGEGGRAYNNRQVPFGNEEPSLKRKITNGGEDDRNCERQGKPPEHIPRRIGFHCEPRKT